MMKQLLLFMLGLILCGQLSAQNRVTLSPEGPLPYKSGERLTYGVYYGFIKGGVAYMIIDEEELNGQRVYHSMLRGGTTGVVGAIYKVDDTYESWFGKDNLLPLKHIRNIREGSYKYYDLATFNRQTNIVTSKKGGEMSMPADVLDLACVCYYMRSLPLEKLQPNDMLDFNTFFAHELFPFQVIYRGKETIDTSMGKVECYRYVPIVEPGRIFNKKDDVIMWFTADENKIPVMAKMDTKMGAFILELTDISNNKYPLTFKAKKK